MDADEARSRQRGEWALSAPGWLAYRENLAAASGTMTSRIVSAAGLRRGDTVLDLACGIGNPGDALAAAVGLDGSVLGLDISPEMIDGAGTWAARKGLDTMSFRVIADETDLGLPAGRFDVAVCRVGLQYMPEPDAALRCVYEALRPGGRMVATTLGSPARCMAFRISSAVIAKHVPPPAGPREGPGPVAISEPEQLSKLLRDAGFADVAVDRFETTLIEIEDAEACWEMFEHTMGPLIGMLARMPAHEAKALREDGIAALRARFADGLVRLTGEVLLASGTKPG